MEILEGKTYKGEEEECSHSKKPARSSSRKVRCTTGRVDLKDAMASKDGLHDDNGKEMLFTVYSECVCW